MLIIRNSLRKHAMEELKRARWTSRNTVFEMNVVEDVMELIDIFAEQGHTETSANLVLSIFSTLAKKQPLSPLQGTKDEWIKVSEGVYQNKRCDTVIKENGQAYHLDARVFVDCDGSCYTTKDSRKAIEFPYYPKTEYVEKKY